MLVAICSLVGYETADWYQVKVRQVNKSECAECNNWESMQFCVNRGFSSLKMWNTKIGVQRRERDCMRGDIKLTLMCLKVGLKYNTVGKQNILLLCERSSWQIDWIRLTGKINYVLEKLGRELVDLRLEMIVNSCLHKTNFYPVTVDVQGERCMQKKS